MCGSWLNHHAYYGNATGKNIPTLHILYPNVAAKYASGLLNPLMHTGVDKQVPLLIMDPRSATSYLFL